MKKTYPINLIVLTVFLLLTNKVLAGTITLGNQNLTAFTTCSGIVSSSQSFTVSGTGLTASLVITPPSTNYEVCATLTGSYTTTLSITPSSGSVSATVYIRLKSTASAAPSGSIACSSTGSQSKNKSIPAGSITVVAGGTLTNGTSSSEVCSGGSVTFTLAGKNGDIINWQSSTSENFGSPATISGTSTSLSVTNLTATAYYRAVVGCGANIAYSTSNLITVVPYVSPNVTIEAANSICSNSGNQYTFLTNTTNGGTSPTYQWTINGSTVSGATNSSFSSANQLYEGSNTVEVILTSNKNCLIANNPTANATKTITVLPLPTITSVTNNSPICVGTDANFTVTGTSGALVNYAINSVSDTVTLSGNGDGIITIPNSTVPQTLNFSLITSAPGCVSDISSTSESTVNFDHTNYSVNGTWDNNFPTSTKSVTFLSDYTISEDFSACSIEVLNGATVTVNSGKNVYLNGSLTVESGSKFILSNNSNLIQADPDAVNIGTIEVNRKSAPIIRLDHTLWSSPVTGQNLRAFSPNTIPYRFYTYNTSTNLYDSSTITDSTVFSPAKGYAIRAPNNYQSTPALEWNGKFSGVPNNGTLTFPMVYVSDTVNYNLVGNPYPSALDAYSLWYDNQYSIFGTFYFYQHTLTMDTSGLFPEGTNYATWTPEGGGVAATVGTNASIAIAPSGVIQVGQGFMVQSIQSGDLIFSNTMRFADTDNPFIKSSSSAITSEKHRMWLNLKSDTGTDLNQILVGYVSGATEGVDNGYDGLAYGNTGSSIYSLINAHNYTIQCRSLPFVTSDEVPLGFKCATAGTYSIQLTSVDGLFNGNQDVFIRDNLTGTDTNIKVAPYTFTSAAGTFDNRFQIVYTQALGVPSTTFNENSVIVYKNTDWFHVSTKGITMKDILVYDISGRLIYKLNDINETTAVLKGLTTTKQILFLKITSTENQSVTIKVLN